MRVQRLPVIVYAISLHHLLLTTAGMGRAEVRRGGGILRSPVLSNASPLPSSRHTGYGQRRSRSPHVSRHVSQLLPEPQYPGPSRPLFACRSGQNGDAEARNINHNTNNDNRNNYDKNNMNSNENNDEKSGEVVEEWGRGLSDFTSMDPQSDYSKRIRRYQVWGPPALVLAGFEPSEAALVKELLAAVGSDFVPVIVVDGELLYKTVIEVVAMPEPEWLSQPWTYNPERMGNIWGADHVILFSGIPIQEQATLLDLLESNPFMVFPPVYPALATMNNKDQTVGKVMADAVSTYRQQLQAKAPKEKSVWREEPKEEELRPVDAPGIGLAPIRDLKPPEPMRDLTEEEMQKIFAEGIQKGLQTEIEKIREGLEKGDLSVLSKSPKKQHQRHP